jgi:uncharacterized protein DUF1801
LSGIARFRKTTADVEDLLGSVPNEQRRSDARKLVDLMTAITGEPPAVWTANIIGFGEARYRYRSGRAGVAALAAFALRKDSLVIYLIGGYQERHHRLVTQLGPHRAGKSCLYVQRLADVDIGILRRLIQRSVDVRRGEDQAATRSEPPT